jgi:hypothetical protein
MAKSGVKIPTVSTIAVRQLQVRLDTDQTQILDFLFEHSRALYTWAMFISRQAYIARGVMPKNGSLFFRDEVKVKGFRGRCPRKNSSTCTPESATFTSTLAAAFPPRSEEAGRRPQGRPFCPRSNRNQAFQTWSTVAAGAV